VAPSTEVERTLAGVWAEVLGREAPIGVHDSFFDLGGHSLMVMRLIAGVREAFGHALSPREIFAGPSLGAMARMIGGTTTATWSPVVEIQSGDGSEAPLFLVHPIEGSVYFCTELARVLGPRHALHALQAHGLEAGQAPCAEMARMAVAYLEAIRRVQPQGPYRLGGYSMGGTVAIEIARRLRAAGEQVAFLGLFDAYPATCGAPRDRAELVAGLWGHALGFAADDIAGLDEDSCAAFVLARGIAAGALPEGYGREDALRQVRVLEANLRAYVEHAPGPYSGEAVLFAASGNAAPVSARDWENVVQGGVTVELVSGDHFGMLQPPHVAVLARALRRHLGSSAAKHGMERKAELDPA
jgi:thioesterase domain-containing protein/acyl carrier protein